MGWTRNRWTLVEFTLAWILMLGLTLLAATQASQAQGVVTTTITDTIYRADGTGAGGTVLVSWPAFSTAAGASVPAGSTSITLGAGGALTVSLAPNAGSTPMGSYYTVVYHLNDGTSTREYWVVPVSSTAVKVSAIRSTVLPLSVAMQTVSKSYVDQAIAAAVSGASPQDSSAYVLKTGDTMTGPLVLPGDPTAPLQAAEKQYVDEQIAGVAGGGSGKVALLPQVTQVVTQPAGTQLEVNNLNGSLYAGQYATGAGNNGIANAAAGPDCAHGCSIQVEQTNPSTETPAPTTWNNTTQLEDRRNGSHRESFFNPNDGGVNIGHGITMTSTETAPQVLAAGGGVQQFWTGLSIASNGLTGGSNEYPKLIQGLIPYFKTTYTALSLQGTYNTPGQHVLQGSSQNCYAVGDCLMGGLFMNASGGFRDDADEGSHPFDLIFQEDPSVFAGTCASGCATGSTAVQVAATQAAGTQGEGRYLIDKNPAKTLTTGSIISGSSPVGGLPIANFSGTSFPLSVFLETAQTIPTQSGAIAPGTVTVPIITGAVPTGYQTSTAALPAASGVACVSDLTVGDQRPLNFETGAYTVVDASHIRLTLHRPHATGATVAVGGLCGYGLEQTVDTQNGIRQVFPVIGSFSATGLFYAGGLSSVVGAGSDTSGFSNVAVGLTSLVRSGGTVTATLANTLPFDVNGLSLTVSGVTDPSYNGTYAVTTTGPLTFTYAESGANSTSSGGTASFLNGSFVLYPMAEVLGVYNPATKAVDGQMTLAANTVPWAAGDVVEMPHYFQELVSADVEVISQTTPRPNRSVSAGIDYLGSNGPGLNGWVISNAAPSTFYYGNGGTHAVPGAGLGVSGVWHDSVEVEAGESSVLRVHCNSHGCDRWNSPYSLFQLDTSVGEDDVQYSPRTSDLSFLLRGTTYSFTPQAMTAGTINVGTLNAGTVTGAVAPSALPVFGPSGTAHAVGAVPDPGATPGTTRFLREDGTWVSAGGSPSVASASGYTTAGPVAFPRRSDLLGEYLLSEGAGTVAHDTSGRGNDGTISGATWEGTTDLNFGALGEYIQLPTGVNGARAWQFAIYAPPFGTGVGVQVPQYGDPSSFGQNPSILCGTDLAHLCLIAGAGKSMQFQAYTTDNTESAELLTAGWHVVTLLCGSNIGGAVTKTHILYDGAEVGGYVAQGDANTCPSPTSGNYQIGGSSVLTGTWFLGKVAAVWAWGANLSLNDGVAASNSALAFIRSKGVQMEYRKIPHAAPVIVGGMDSRTFGVQLTPTTTWLATMNLTDTTYTRLNLGYSGESTLDACAMFDLTYGTQISEASGPVVLMLWGGINDMLFSYQNARQIANNLRCMVKKAKAASARVILATEISAESNSNPAIDTMKDNLDAILRAEAFGWGADNLADLATDVHLGADGASSNTACFPDNLHPSAACEPYVTAIMQDAMNELLGSSERNRNQTAAATYQELAGDRFLDLTGTAAQTVTLPDCTGYSLPRQMVNLGSAGATVSPVSGQTLLGATALAVGAKATFVPIPGPLATGGCKWERTE
jgi:lysophospholipase L1-like esterase